MSSDTNEDLPLERRQIQRIFTSGLADATFFCVISGRRWPLIDLSLAGFALPASAASQGQRFALVLMCAGKAESIHVFARVVNYLNSPAGEQVGCLFDDITDEQSALLRAWLVEYVLGNASVPIDEADAIRIVTGPSLV